MANASDKELGVLHKKLAKAMSDALESSDAAKVLLDEHAEDLPGPVLDFLERHASANPALLTAIAKFLKDNDITCAKEDSKEMTELEQRLAAKKRKSVGNVVALHDEDE